MRVYRWKKPELTVTLTTGGSLLPNTTYWIFGFFHSLLGGYKTYYGGHSPHSVPVSFTTDSVKRSISVAWKTSGNITRFSDAGNGKTLVTSPLHCLSNLYSPSTTKDRITIESGAYAGSWYITWIDYNTFTIDTPFKVNEPAVWKCDHIPNSASSIKFWMNTINPEKADGTFAGNTYQAKSLSHSPYVNGYMTTPVSISAPYTETQQLPQSLPFLPYPSLYLDSGWKYITDIGMPAFVETGTTFPSLPALNQMFIDSGLYPYCNAHAYQYSDVGILSFFGFMEAPNVVSGAFKRLALFVPMGTFFAPGFTFTDSATLFGYAISRNYAGYKARNTVTICPVRTQFDLAPSDFEPNTLNLQKLLVNYQLVSSANIYSNLNIVSGFSLYLNYPILGYVQNSSLVNTYIYWVMAVGKPADGFRSLRNLSITKNNTGYADFVIYDYNTAGVLYIQHFENISTDRPENLKSCTMNYPGRQIDVVFWRKGKIHVNIDSVICIITDSLGNVYNFPSMNGIIEFDVIEQLSYPRYNSLNDNVIYDFSLQIKSDGYQDYNSTFRIASDLDGQYISLTPVLPVVYSDLRIETSIESEVELEVFEKVEDKIVSICELADALEAIINIEPTLKITADYEEYRNI